MKNWRKFPYITFPLGILILALAFQVARINISKMSFEAFGVSAKIEATTDKVIAKKGQPPPK